MTEDTTEISVLLIEDDKENLKLLGETLPQEMDNCSLRYESCDSFDDARTRLRLQRYDIVVTDIYRDRPGMQSKTNEDDAEAADLVEQIRSTRFCPVIAFTDGSFPVRLEKRRGPFLKLADKSGGNEKISVAIAEILQTGIPQIARRLHDELDQAAGPDYLWGFLESRWNQLTEKAGELNPEILERIIRRRAAIQIGRLVPESHSAEELSEVAPHDYYIMPPISASYRLGMVLRENKSSKPYVLLTPHCYLEVQEGETDPRADEVLLIAAIDFAEIFSKQKESWPKNEKKLLEKLRRCLQSPPELGTPRGRYWFLPGFLEIPDSYCDFLQVKSVSYSQLESGYTVLAVLDAPFAEAFQSCFNSFYSSVGLPALSPEHFMHFKSKMKAPESG